MLVGNSLTKSWGTKSALSNVDVTVKRGQITVVIGPSGSGKTSLVRTLSLLDIPDAGSISIDDQIYHFPLASGQKFNRPWPDVTVVFQQLFLWPHLRLRENITLPLRNLPQKEQDQKLNKLINTFGMHNFIDRYPNETSLGERQRAALARALILEPSYILLDEITSALDVEQVDVILNLLQTLRDDGIGILIVTHLLGFARRAADQFIFLDNGKAIESGDRELLKNPSNERVQRFLSILESVN